MDEWGRFLDNHYDPEIHKKPFTIAMKAPDRYINLLHLFYIGNIVILKELVLVTSSIIVEY